MAKKTEKDPTEELLNAADNAIRLYEEYLLDQIGWRELAQTMDILRKSVIAVKKEMASKEKS